MAEYPKELTSQLKPDDAVVSYLPLKGKGGFIAVTEQRLIFRSVFRNNNTHVDTKETTNVPISKVSSITVIHKKGGCMSKEETGYFLKVNVQGGIYDLPVGKTSEAADEFVRTFLDLSE